ncbi:unnamed protein product [Rhodiola kirilowii]
MATPTEDHMRATHHRLLRYKSTTSWFLFRAFFFLLFQTCALLDIARPIGLVAPSPIDRSQDIVRSLVHQSFPKNIRSRMLCLNPQPNWSIAPWHPLAVKLCGLHAY